MKAYSSLIFTHFPYFVCIEYNYENVGVEKWGRQDLQEIFYQKIWFREMFHRRLEHENSRL
jgi:hypothetical protein